MDESLKHIKEEEEASDLAQDVGNVSLPFLVPRTVIGSSVGSIPHSLNR